MLDRRRLNINEQVKKEIEGNEPKLMQLIDMKRGFKILISSIYVCNRIDMQVNYIVSDINYGS